MDENHAVLYTRASFGDVGVAEFRHLRAWQEQE